MKAALQHLLAAALLLSAGMVLGTRIGDVDGRRVSQGMQTFRATSGLRKEEALCTRLIRKQSAEWPTSVESAVVFPRLVTVLLCRGCNTAMMHGTQSP